jgi:hypothetical protein
MVPPSHNVSSSGWATITATALDFFCSYPISITRVSLRYAGL